MLAKFRVFAIAAAGFALFTGSAWAQISAIEGDVKGPDGQPLKGASILIEREDMKGVYKGAKTDKKGHYIYNGLPLGTYKVSLLVDGQVKDSMGHVKTSLGDPQPINFDLQKVAEQQAEVKKAAETGTLSKEQERSMTKEQKEAFDKAAKENAAKMAHNKALNDAFNAGMQASEAKQYDVAIDSFKKAGEIDPQQEAVWANLARAYSDKAEVEKRNPEQAQQRLADLQSAADAYQKAIQIQPGESGLHLNLALCLANMKKTDDAKAELEKAAQIDPSQAGKAYYNLGAIMINSGQSDAAGDAFQKAISLDPNYADAYYQLGLVLMAKPVTVGADGKTTYAPGTAEAFQKYLELKPNGSNADAAKGLLEAMGAKVQTTYVNPNAPKSKDTKKK